jgi:hypothetical protein
MDDLEQLFWRRWKAGTDVRRARKVLDLYGHRSVEEVTQLRKQAAVTAAICARCFSPLGLRETVTMLSLPIHVPAWKQHMAHDRWLRVPICISCWLGSNVHSADIDRFRCEGCNRPMRVKWSHRSLYHSERVCCRECWRKMTNRRESERCKVVQTSKRCANPKCRKSFTPTRAML